MSKLEVVLVALLAGCGGTAELVGPVDASRASSEGDAGGGGGPDGGSAQADAGRGGGGNDSGAGALDAGGRAFDAGFGEDAGGAGRDAGVGEDAGAPAADGGARGADGGAAASDAGSPPSDGICDYGKVPSGTPPAAWQDSPALTPLEVNPYGAPSKTLASGYLLLNEGASGASQVSVETQTSILQRINQDLKLETQYSYIHLPPFTTGISGKHPIDYWFTNTGLPADPGATGDQSWEGQYPMVETDSNGMADAQRWDLTHEFNHVLQSAYGTIDGNQVSWVHESHNDYLILRLVEMRNGATPGQTAQFDLPSNIAYLDTLVYDQPYVPIESCGITSSGGVTGPADYMQDSTGYRYNDLFPLFVSQRVGQYVYAAIWENAKSGEQNLQTLTRLMDKARVQCMVADYAARLALGDFLELSTSVQERASAGMYVATTNQDGWLVPSDSNKLPRFTGRNNIPIAVSSGATQVSVSFSPDAAGSKGTPADMRAQIAYRATDGSAAFSTPVSSGTTTVNLTKPPKDGVVVLVVSNVTMDGYKSPASYGWDPSETFGYKVQVSGGTPASTSRTYF